VTKADPNAGLKSIFAHLLHRVGGLDAAATCTRVKRAQLGNYGNLNVADIFAPVDVVVTLEDLVGEPLLTQEMARRAGYAMVPVEPVAEGELAALLAKVGAESGAVFAAYGDALADGRVDAPERARIARELQDLIRAAHAALGILAPGPTPVPENRNAA
jgi:hypothetical protein